MNLHQQRAEAALQLRRFELAEREAASGLQDNPQDAELLALQARAVFDQDRFSEALSLAKTLVSLFPEWGYGHHLIALNYHHQAWLANLQGESDESEEYLERAQQAADTALNCDPNEPFYLASASLIELFQGRVSVAIELALAGLEIAPENADCLEAAAQAWLADGSHMRALEIAKQGLSIDPENARLHLAAAEILADLGQVEQALVHSRSALQQDPNDVRIWNIHRDLLKSTIWFVRPLRTLKSYFDRSRAFCLLYLFASLIAGPLMVMAISVFLPTSLAHRWLEPAIGCGMLFLLAGVCYRQIFAIATRFAWAIVGSRIERYERELLRTSSRIHG